ncbi:MAG: hypothetical protein R3D60_09575 [Paracoccaceae bacterium]
MSLPHPLDNPGLYAHVMPKRLMAWAVDVAVTLIITLIAGLAVALMTLGIGLLLFPFLWIAISIAYRWVLLTRYGADAGDAAGRLAPAPAGWRTPGSGRMPSGIRASIQRVCCSSCHRSYPSR